MTEVSVEHHCLHPSRPQPPPLPGHRAANLRRATAANVFLPGAGLYLLGQRTLGVVLIASFLACFAAVLAIFLSGYAGYLRAALDPELLGGDRLERMGEGFHVTWLLALAGLGVTVYAVATVLFVRARGAVREGT